MAHINKQYKKNRSFFPVVLIITLLLVGAGGYAYITYFEGEKPQIQANTLPQFIGNKSTVSVTISDKQSGLRRIEIFVEQAGNERSILSKDFPRQGKDGKGGTAQEVITVNLTPKALKLKEGEAVIRIRATDYSMQGFFKGNSSELSHTVTIDTKPPKVSIIHTEKHITPGGSGIIIYRAQDSAKQGVMLNGHYHPGFPVTDGSDAKFISYIGLSYATQKINEANIIAEDTSGNRTIKPFSTILIKPKQKKDKIHVSDGFLSKKIPEFEDHYPEMEGTLVEKYLYANRIVRKSNNQQIHDLCLNPQQKRLWVGRFLRMAGSGKAGFADHRTYYYKGEAIDKQVHLGMDIASTKHAKIKAAGTGKVIFDQYLGIYGNMVMLDHGQGIFSLYSHLSQINVTVGDMLNKGDILGHSGISGMAGGDHLHFSILVNGIFVTPKEWWDPNWITITIDEPLTNAKF